MILKLSRLKQNKVFMENLRWDVTPEVLFKPRFAQIEKDIDIAKETQGFMFYIDYMDDCANLMLMKTYHLRSKTVGQIEDVPQELLLNAVKRQGAKSIIGMYSIDNELESWLRARLGGV